MYRCRSPGWVNTPEKASSFRTCAIKPFRLIFFLFQPRNDSLHLFYSLWSAIAPNVVRFLRFFAARVLSKLFLEDLVEFDGFVGFFWFESGEWGVFWAGWRLKGGEGGWFWEGIKLYGIYDLLHFEGVHPCDEKTSNCFHFKIY